MILMVVAVGIGLAAAFLTSQIGAKTAAAPETVKLPVAKMELAVGTLLTEEKMDKQIGYAEFPKNSVTPEVVSELEKLRNKRLTRTLRLGDKIMVKDLGVGGSIAVPKGLEMYALPMNAVKAVAGFALPGSKIDVILTESQNNKTTSSVILRDMLVVAVDIIDRKPEGASNAVPTLNSVSLAVEPIQGQMLALAGKRGEITFMLRDPESTDKTPLPPIDKLPFDRDTPPKEIVEGPKTIKLPVAKVEIEPGMKITRGNLDELFGEREFLDPAPPSAVRSREELIGKYLTRSLDPDQFVPLAVLTDKEPKVEAPMIVEEQPRGLRHELTISNGASRSRTVFEQREGIYRALDNQNGSQEAAAPSPRRGPVIESIPPRVPQVPAPILPIPMGNDAGEPEINE